TVERCIAEGLVGAECFAVDASLIRADVHRQRSVPGEQGLPPEAAGRAVREYLEVLIWSFRDRKPSHTPRIDGYSTSRSRERAAVLSFWQMIGNPRATSASYVRLQVRSFGSKQSMAKSSSNARRAS